MTGAELGEESKHKHKQHRLHMSRFQMEFFYLLSFLFSEESGIS